VFKDEILMGREATLGLLAKLILAEVKWNKIHEKAINFY
jgi:hypothetical protein